jgi:DamX protein
VRNGTAPRRNDRASDGGAASGERKHTVIEPKPRPWRKRRLKRKRSSRSVESARPPPAPSLSRKPQPGQRRRDNRTNSDRTTAPAATAAPADCGKTAGDVSSMKSAPSGHYTLQLSSSSNYNNLNSWAKKEKLDKYVVYETSRNGQPWYVLVSGIYASKDEAKRAVTSLPADVQAKNPWAKPLHQVQADLK